MTLITNNHFLRHSVFSAYASLLIACDDDKGYAPCCTPVRSRVIRTRATQLHSEYSIAVLSNYLPSPSCFAMVVSLPQL
jgi:hypothetical protein